MSGITAAQYIRRKADIKVYTHVKAGITYCVVKQGEKEISRTIDDAFGTLTWLTLSNLAETAYNIFRSHRKYPVPACSTLFNCFDVSTVKTFDMRWFTEDVLPKIKGKTNVEKIANEYTHFDFETSDITEQYEIYDWIVRLYVQLRRMKWDVSEVEMPAGARVDNIMSVLGNLKTAQFVEFGPGQEAMVPALKAVFPEAVEIDGPQGKVWVCNPSEHMKDPLGLSGDTFEAVDWKYDPVEHATLNPTPKSIHAAEEMADCGNEIPEYRDIFQKVVKLLTTPHQSFTEEETAFATHGGNPAILDVQNGGIGKGKLLGLGRVCGEGQIRECIDRVYNHLKPNLPNFSDKDVLNLAAGRISKMSSEKRPVRKGNEVHLVKRA